MSEIFKEKSLVAIEFDESNEDPDQVIENDISEEVMESNKDFENELLSEV